MVLPYREIDQSGVLFTALAFGKPILATRVGGFPGFAFPFGGARPTDGGGARKTPTLAVGVDDKTNSLIVSASTTLFDDIKKLTEERARAAFVGR